MTQPEQDHDATRGAARPSTRHANEVIVVDLQASTEALEVCEANSPRLSTKEVATLTALKNPDVRRARRASYIARRLCLERHLGESVRQSEFTVSAAGKPELPNAAIGFNLSHSGQWALVGIANTHQIGVDIVARDRERHANPELRKNVERAGLVLADGVPLPDADDEARYLAAWARIEAVIKAQGATIAKHKDIIMRGRGDPTVMRNASLSQEADPLLARDLLTGPDVFAAVALPAEMQTPALIKLPADVDAINAFATG